MSIRGSDPDEDVLSASERGSPEPNQSAFRARLAQYAHAAPASRRVTRAAKKEQDSENDSVSMASRGTSSPAKRVGVSLQERTPKKKRRSAKERSRNDPYSPDNKLVDSLRPGLILVFIGLNPGLRTAETGHAYAHPSNRFWHLLHQSGVTTKKHMPSETHDLPDLYLIGNTNICARPTRDGSGLSKEELAQGAVTLEEKIRKYKPEAVCIVGKQIWETLWLARTGQKLKKDKFKWGWQDDDVCLGRELDEDGEVSWAGARTYVTTSTSGLSAAMKPHEKLEVWQPLGEWFKKRRKQGAVDSDDLGSS